MELECVHKVKEWVFTGKILNSHGRLMVGSQNQPVFPLCSLHRKRLFTIHAVNKDRTRKSVLKNWFRDINLTEIRGGVDYFN